jgi:membrane-anchored glycerophosphoryl diester phosphodiesterase (GDPDase)
VVAIIGFLLLLLPGLAVLAFISFAAFYLLPYMVDQKLGLFDALKASWQTAMQEPVSEHIVVVIIYVAITSLGSSLWFAFLITQPMATFIMVEAYNYRVLGNKRGGQAGPEDVDVPPASEDD